MALGTPYLIGSASQKAATATLVISVGSTAAGSTGTGNSTVAGDAIVVGASIQATETITNVQDSQSNSYVTAVNATAINSTIWVALNTTALVSGTDTITITYSGATSLAQNAAAVGCSGVATASAVDIAVQATGTSAAPSVATGTLAQASELLVSYESDAFSGGAITWGGAWVSQAGSIKDLSNHFSSIATQVVSSTASVNAAGTITSALWEVLAISLKASTGTPATVSLPALNVPVAAPLLSVSTGTPATVSLLVLNVPVAALAVTVTVGASIGLPALNVPVAALALSVSTGTHVSISLPVAQVSAAAPAITVTTVSPLALLVSMAARAGVDGYGNTFPAGFAASAGQIPGGLINPGTINNAQLAALAVNSANIANNTITAAQVSLTAGLLGTMIANSTITTTQIAAAAGITGAQIAAATVGAANIVAHAITAGQIAANTITAAQIAASTITAGQIAANTITASQILAATITSAQIAAATIVAGNIAAGTITGSNIAAGTITASNILASTITAAQIAAGTITASQIAAGIVIAGIVNATTITGANLVLDGTSGDLLIYSGTPASGNLIIANSPVSGTDGFGNAYPAGISLQGAGQQTVIGPAGQQIVLSASSGVPVIELESGRSEELFPARITQQLVNSGAGNEIIALLLSSAEVNAQHDEGFITLLSSPADASSTAGVSLNYLDTSAVPHKYLAVGGFGLEVFSPFASDTNSYDAGRLTLDNFANIGQVINATAATITGLTKPLGIGKYHIRGIICGVQGPGARAQTIQFAGPATSVGNIYVESNAEGNTSVTDVHLPLPFPATHNTPAWTAGTVFFVRFDGQFVTTAAGTLSIVGGGAAVDTWEVSASWLEIEPVVAT